MAIDRDQVFKWRNFYKEYEGEIEKIKSNAQGQIEFLFSSQMYADLFCSDLSDISRRSIKIKNNGSSLSKKASDKDDSEQYKIVTFSKEQYCVLQTMLKDKLKSYDDLFNPKPEGERKVPVSEKKEDSPSKRLQEKRPPTLALFVSPSDLSSIMSSARSSASAGSIFSPDGFGSPMSGKLPLSPTYLSHPIFSLSRSKSELKQFNFPLPLPALENTNAMISSWQEKKIHIKYPYSFLLNYLSGEDLLNYRQVSHKTLEETKKMVGPYSSFAEFIIATSGTFNKTHRTYEKNKERCYTAWTLYQNTIRHQECKGFSVLYKFNKLRITTKEYAGEENIWEQGRVYTPGRPEEKKHDLDVNLSWTLAQIHAGRSIIALSNITAKNFIHSVFPTKFSAFARELGSLYNAGYKVSECDTNNGCLIFSPVALESYQLTRLTIRDIRPSDSDIEAAFHNFCEHGKKSIMFDLKKTITKIKKFLIRIDTDVYSKNELLDFKEQYNASLDDLLSVLKTKEYPKFAHEQFILLFNQTPQIGLSIQLSAYSEGFFDKTKLFSHIKKNILNMINTKIDAALERISLQPDYEPDLEEEFQQAPHKGMKTSC